MSKQTKLLETIKATFIQEVAIQQPYELDEHIPIYNHSMQIIGYWNIRCYDDMRKMLQNSTVNVCPASVK